MAHSLSAHPFLKLIAIFPKAADFDAVLVSCSNTYTPLQPELVATVIALITGIYVLQMSFETSKCPADFYSVTQTSGMKEKN